MKPLFIALLLLSQTLFAGEPKVQPIHGNYNSGQKIIPTTQGNMPAVELNLNKDNTFTYFKYLGPNQNVNCSGTWEANGNKIILTTESNLPLAKKWKLDENYPCVTSRLGLEFTRICTDKK